MAVGGSENPLRNAEGDLHTIRPMTNSSTGAIHRWRNVLIPTAREAPADAETVSHILLHRAGFVRPVGAGIYDYLPLAWRTLSKIQAIIRAELDAAGACEMLMPALEPFELFKDTKRDVDYGDNLFRVTDRKGRVNALAPTHEEVITELLRGCVTSYKQLPLNIYQIQTKFRDEARPRAGLLRCREFIMKDAYSFHDRIEGVGGLNETYDVMHKVYTNSFKRCGLDFTPVDCTFSRRRRGWRCSGLSTASPRSHGLRSSWGTHWAPRCSCCHAFSANGCSTTLPADTTNSSRCASRRRS